MCIHPLHLAEIWLFGHDEEPERALFVYTPLGIVKHKASEGRGRRQRHMPRRPVRAGRSASGGA